MFEALYLLVTGGHEDPGAVVRLDPPSDYFRVRWVAPVKWTHAWSSPDKEVTVL